MVYQVYGIKTCDTVRKACKWLEAQGIQGERVDLRTTPPSRELVTAWVAQFGAKALKNTSGGAYRALPEEKKTWGEAEWINAFSEDPMLIKRPVIVRDGTPLGVGFRGTEAELQARLIE